LPAEPCAVLANPDHPAQRRGAHAADPATEISMKYFVLAVSLGLSLDVYAGPMLWADIRDGSLYLQPDNPDTLSIQWVPAWQADANEERLYLLDGQGKLQDERV